MWGIPSESASITIRAISQSDLEAISRLVKAAPLLRSALRGMMAIKELEGDDLDDATWEAIRQADKAVEAATGDRARIIASAAHRRASEPASPFVAGLVEMDLQVKANRASGKPLFAPEDDQDIRERIAKRRATDPEFAAALDFLGQQLNGGNATRAGEPSEERFDADFGNDSGFVP